MVSLEFFIVTILQAVLCPWGWFSLENKWVPGIFPGRQRKAFITVDTLTTFMYRFYRNLLALTSYNHMGVQYSHTGITLPSSLGVQWPIWLFSVLRCFRDLPVCCLCIFWVIMRWFQLPLLLLVSILFYLSYSFIQVVCLTTGPNPLPKRALHIARSRASSFKWEYPLLSLRSSSSFLRLLPRLPVTSIHPCIFPSVTRCRRQFQRKMWPIQFAFRLRISCSTFLCSYISPLFHLRCDF
jgi:hypothetical protein